MEPRDPMTTQPFGTAVPEQSEPGRNNHAGLDLAPIPRITIGAFCDTPQVVSAVEAATSERRMSRAGVKVHIGSIPAAIEAYRQIPTPNLVLVESRLTGDQLISQ